MLLHKTTAEKLAESLELGAHTNYDYFDYCVVSYLNGNFEQCRNLFKDLPHQERKDLLNYIEATDTLTDVSAVYSFYFNLL
jgi:Fe-S oxidoreductase